MLHADSNGDNAAHHWQYFIVQWKNIVITVIIQVFSTKAMYLFNSVCCKVNLKYTSWADRVHQGATIIIIISIYDIYSWHLFMLSIYNVYSWHLFMISISLVLVAETGEMWAMDAWQYFYQLRLFPHLKGWRRQSWNSLRRGTRLQSGKKKKKHFRMNYIQEGIGHGRQPAGQVATQLRGGGGGNARNTVVLERNLCITITQNQSRTVWETQNESSIITVSRGGISSMGKRLRWESDMWARNGNLVITDLVGSTIHARHLWTTAKLRDIGGGWGDVTEESRRTEVTEARGPTRGG
jgi:hypothetical protein